ncbi:MAG: 3-dehydroquinate synthase [Gammaproteobacteria bacterium]|jgi:3-dehydroquinate synthase
MANTIKVGKGSSKYEVIISKNALTKSNLAPQIKSSKNILIVTDSGIPKKYIKELKAKISNNKNIYTHELPQGETSKSANEYLNLLEKLAKLKFDRSDLMIALGGGMVGDITGFTAASYLRGIDFIQIPTSLLAQVDSSVGGKTAINIERGKNLVGAFYNPKLVLISTSFLETLPNNQFRSGLGEIVKYSLLGNKKIRSILENNSKEIQKKDPIVMENLVSESIKTKAKIVTKDEKENGIRAILNLGHTFGHAIEAFKKYKGITHGQAVIYGIQIIARISYLEGLIDQSKYKDLDNTIHSLELDTDFQKFKYQDLKKFIMNDKKVTAGKLNLIMLDKNLNGFKTNKFDSKNLPKAFKLN